MGEGRHGPVPEPRAAARGILIVTGSQREIVDDQMVVLGDRTDLVAVEVSVGETLNGIGADSARKLASAVAEGRVAVIKLGKLDPGSGSGPAELQKMAGRIVNNLGRAVRDIMDTSRPDALIVIGGDTASGVLDACGVSTIHLQGELQPGTVGGTPVDGSLAGALLVTRAGGFGDENSLAELVSLLRSGGGV